MDQLEFFKEFVKTKKISTNVRKCKRCLETKDLEDFDYFSTILAGRKNTCKKCCVELKGIRRMLKKQNPMPPFGLCPICKCYTENWVLDHVHDTESFRGYICDSCNLGLGRFHDDPEILKAAIDYINRNKTLQVCNNSI